MDTRWGGDPLFCPGWRPSVVCWCPRAGQRSGDVGFIRSGELTKLGRAYWGRAIIPEKLFCLSF